MGATTRTRWDRVVAHRPRIGTAFLTYLHLADHTVPHDTGGRYRFHEITSGSDPMLARFAPRWQQRLTRRLLDEGAWYALVALDGDEVAAHVWVASRTVKGRFNGVVDLRLAEDEAYAFDLYIRPGHRRASLGNEMGDRLIRTFKARGIEWAYTHVLFDNPGSVIWHHTFGYNWVQIFNYLTIGPRIWWRLPFGTCPRFGPMSRRGRHSTASPEAPFGGAMLPH
jgi:ribosomal protein S18 acetylase RimI-like enzyme